MTRLTAYFVFAGIYGGLLLLAGFAADELNSEVLGAAATWSAPFAAAPLALMASMRLRHLSNVGIAFSSVILAVIACTATIGILLAIAIPVAGSLTFEFVAGMFTSYFTIGGWRLLLSFGLLLAAPLLWAPPLQRRLRPNNSFKPKPLRGSA